ncbi:MAG: hypothetical protein EA424_16975 [Planctomycetaceae bacterium]|nr:MAG: hypothetical protein EA424_16975 [Planctomycetaceae bacterium]
MKVAHGVGNQANGRFRVHVQILNPFNYKEFAGKTKDRMMYDQRLKAQRDYQWGLDSAREKGRQEGELLGKIRILQELLGDEPSTPENLDERTIGELSEILADLQQRLRSRDS